MADSRERARAGACAARSVAAFIADHSDNARVSSEVVSSVTKDLASRAQRAEGSASGADPDPAYVAATEADSTVGFLAALLDWGDDLNAVAARCRIHRHELDADANDADAAYSAAYTAYATAREAALEWAKRTSMSYEYTFRAMRVCCRKRRYDTAVDAQRAADERSREAGVRLYVYECDVDLCGGWHLTSKPR